jgi:hypothetical protein
VPAIDTTLLIVLWYAALTVATAVLPVASTFIGGIAAWFSGISLAGGLMVLMTKSNPKVNSRRLALATVGPPLLFLVSLVAVMEFYLVPLHQTIIDEGQRRETVSGRVD